MAGESYGDNANIAASVLLLTQSKRKRKREKEKANRRQATEKKTKVQDRDRSASHAPPEMKSVPGDERIDSTIGKLDPKLLADLLGQKLRNVEKDMSLVELEDRLMPESAFADTTTWALPRTSDHLASYIETFSGLENADSALSKAPASNGSPHTLVLTAAALRAANLARRLRHFQTKESKVAKLFAKHIKFEESAELCQKLRISMGVGTPSRVFKLVQEGYLKVEELDRIVIDASAVNEKGQNVLDIRETYKPLMELLNVPSIKPKIGTRIKIIVF